MQYPHTSDSSALPVTSSSYVTGDESSQAGPPLPSFDGTQACAGADQRLFFPTRGYTGPSIAAAKGLCADCGYLDQCLEYALARGRSLMGVWGGTTDEERRAIVRRRRQLTAGAAA